MLANVFSNTQISYIGDYLLYPHCVTHWPRVQVTSSDNEIIAQRMLALS